MNKKTLYKTALFSLFFIAVGCSNSILVAPTAEPEKKVEYFADNALGNALAMIQHPAGIHEQGVTYVTYQGPQEDPYVAAYNHNSQQWLGPVKSGTSDLGKNFHKKLKIDNHGKPTMVIDDLGYIHVFYGGHGAGKKYGKNPYGGGGLGRNKHAVSKRPYDIGEWQELDNVSIFGTYNQAVKMDNGDIYLIYRHGAHRSDWVYQKSTDHGRTFAPAVQLLKHKNRSDIKATDSWYVWASKGQGDDIILSYDYHVCWLRGEGPRGRGHVTERHDLYYMVLDTKTDQVRNIHGEQLALPVTKELADEKTLAVRTADDHWTFNGSAHLDKNGFPHLAINIGKDLGQNTGGPKQSSYYRWDGSQWLGGAPISVTAKIDNTSTRGDFYIDESSSKIKFLLGYQEQQQGVIAQFESVDLGKTFTKKQEWLRRPNASWALSARITNAHPDAQIIVVEKVKGTQWRKVYLLGENGPIKRNQETATVLKPEDTVYMK